MEHALPSFTAISKPFKYISRAARSDTIESAVFLASSWLLQAKCFTVASAPLFLIPFTTAAANFPVRYGSSEKYSKFLPFNGFL